MLKIKFIYRWTTSEMLELPDGSYEEGFLDNVITISHLVLGDNTHSLSPYLYDLVTRYSNEINFYNYL